MEHDYPLIKYLAGPIRVALVSELIRTTRNVIKVPEQELLPTPPVTPLESHFKHQQQQKQPQKQQQQRQQNTQQRYQQSQPQTTLSHQASQIHPVRLPAILSPEWCTLEQFIPRLIVNAKARINVPTLCYTLLVLDRLRSKLPPRAEGRFCSRHRIFFAALIIASKYLNDTTPKNRHWETYCCGLFETTEITLMEKQLLDLIEFDLRFTEKQLIERLFPLIHPRPTAVYANSHTLAVPSQPLTPLTPLTPITPSNAVKGAPASELNDRGTRPPLHLKAEVVPRDFVLQPVPVFKKRVEKHKGGEPSITESSAMSLSTSQSAPSHLVNERLPVVPPVAALPEIRVVGSNVAVSMPLVRSVSSDGMLEGNGSTSMNFARTFSSTVSSSMTASSSISTSTSTSNSEVSTPLDSSASFDHMIKPHAMHRRGSDSIIHPQTSGPIVTSYQGGNSRLMSKFLGIGKSFSPARRVGHGIRGDRKVSTATIVPDEVYIEH